MFIKHIPIAIVRASATHCLALWRQVAEKVQEGDWKAAAAKATAVQEHLVAANLVALGSLVEVCVAACAAESEMARGNVKTALRVVEYELNLLAKSKIEPSVWLFDSASGLASASSVRMPLRSSFFLPVAPMFMTADRKGSIPAAWRDYGVVLKSQIESLSGSLKPEAALDNIRNTVHALENRGLPGPLGLAFMLLMGWLERNEITPVETVVLSRMTDWLARAAAAENYRPTLSDLQLVSSLALHVVNAPGRRCQGLSRHWSLADLLEKRSLAADKLPPSAAFGGAWHQLATSWDSLAAQPGRERSTAFVAAFGAMLKVTSEAPVLTRIVREIGRLFNSFSKIPYRSDDDRRAAFGTMAEMIAALQDAYNSHDPATIETTAQECRETVTKIVETGTAQRLAIEPVLPVADLFNEIALEVSRAVVAVTKSDLAGAGQILESVKLSMTLVKSTETGAALLDRVNRTQLHLRGLAPTAGESVVEAAAKTVSCLERSFTVAASAPQACMEILRDLDARLAKSQDPVVGEIDEPEDREIFEIFFQESIEVCRAIQAICSEAESAGSLDYEHAMDMRRGWHTLKGSSRMAGLVHLGEGAWQFESRLNEHLARNSAPYGWVLASKAGVTWFNRICEQIARDGKAPVDFSELERALALSSSTAPVATAPANHSSSDAVPVDPPKEGFGLDLDFTFVAPPAPRPVEAATPAVFSQTSTAPIAAEIDLPDFILPDETVVEEVVLVGDLSYSGEPLPEIDPDVLKAVQLESAEMMGIIKRALSHLGATSVPYEMVRAAHTLVGMSRIVGLKGLEALAEATENWATFHYAGSLTPSAESIRLLTALEVEMAKAVDTLCAGFVYEPDTAVAMALSHQGSDSNGAESLAKATAMDGGDAAAHAKTPAPVRAPVPQVLEPLESTVLSSAPVATTPPPAKVVKDMADSISDQKIVDVVSRPVRSQPQQGTVAGAFEIDNGVQDDIDQEVLQSYVEEAEEILAALDKQIEAFQPGITSFNEINRLLHTIKGGARLTGMLRLGSMLHAMEDATMASDTLSERDAAALIERVQRSLDLMRSMLERATFGEIPEVKDDATTAAVVAREEGAVLRVAPQRLEVVAEELGQLRVTQDRVKRRTTAGFDSIDQLKNPIGRLQELARRISDDAERSMDAGVERNVTPDGKFDALEMDRFTTMHENTRRLLEAVNDIVNIVHTTDEAFREIDRSMRSQTELSDRIQQGINAIGMSALAAIEPRLRATVRQAADDAGKSCQIQIDGDAKIERSVMDRLVPALEHLIRNSIAHGIEDAGVRQRRGKKPQGLILISARSEGSHAVIKVRDDGGGIDFRRVLEKAVRMGMIRPGHDATEQELTEVIYAPGFSTADSVTALAGRGVGMDAVRESIQRIGGRVETKSYQGQGVEFTLRVPTSARYISGLLLQTGGAPYIVPSALVDGMRKIEADKLQDALESPGSKVEFADGASRILYALAWLVGAPGTRLKAKSHPSVLVPRGNSDFVVYAEQSEHVTNMPLKQFTGDFGVGTGILGYSTLSDGRLAVVVNPEMLVSTLRQGGDAAFTGIAQELAKEDQEAARPLVLVVDDSITVRTVTSRLLTRHGYRVATAENGAIALEKMVQERPSVVLMDIEMPVMDGFEALKAIKMMPEIEGVPVAIISSRNADKHRGIATDLGAAAFFGKPYRDQELLEWVRSNMGDVLRTQSMLAAL
jgi:chemotaxis protein histidine kinase CheA/ActR/RegA family two-component response regulator